jgi:ATP-dependent DNA helicase RecG
MKIPLKEPLTKRHLGSTDARIKLLKEIGIYTIRDLLEYFPRTYEDFTKPTDLGNLTADRKNLLQGKFIEKWGETTKNKMKLVKAIFEEKQSGGEVECVWFNNPYIEKRIPLHKEVLITAKAKLAFGKISLQSPAFEESDSKVHLGRIVPVYREHEKLKTTWLREKIFELLEHTEAFANIVPKDIALANDLINRNTAITELHFPTTTEKLKQARHTIAFEELFLLQLSALQRKQTWQDSATGNALQIPLDAELISDFFKTLPYTPTNSQKIALFEILRDFEKPFPMLRLLEGDVGAGKTLVAVGACLPVIKQKAQCAILAPTEILAQQHFVGVQKLLHNYDKGITVALLTGSIKGKKREEILEKLRFGKIDIIVGTHALLEEWVVFKHLAFVVIDEQHRFGVAQRDRLISKGTPHVLQMTATPIPRTLAIVAFGDQDLSVLTELPPGRKKIHTKVVPPSSRTQVELFLESEVKKGRQGFVICPLVAESEKSEAKAATEEYNRLTEEMPNLRFGLLHGKMKPAEKDAVMQQFQNREFDFLVSTSVVEVGVDVPNATIMLIEGAERFGLAQLHQFRGRVGRGEHQSYCFLFPTENVTERLRAMENEHDGFRLAEIDMHLRGPGEIFGIRQSGIPDMKMASITDPRLVADARKAAEEFLEQYTPGGYIEIDTALKKLQEKAET